MGRRNVPLRNGNEACKSRLGGQQIVTTWIEAVIGNAIADREEFTGRIEEKAKFHLVEYRFRDAARASKGGGPAPHRLRQNVRDPL